MIIRYKTSESNFRIKNNGVISVFYLFQVDKLRLIRHRDTSFNIILVSSAIVCFAIGIFISELFSPVKIISILWSILFFIFSLTYRANKIELVLLLKDNHTVKIFVDNSVIDEVERQVFQINKVLRKANDNYSFSSNEMGNGSTLNQYNLRYMQELG